MLASIKRLPFPGVKTPISIINTMILKVGSGRPSGQIESQPRDTHLSQGTCGGDMVRMVLSGKDGTAPAFWALSEAVKALHFDHTET